MTGTVAAIAVVATVVFKCFAFLAITSILGTLCAHEMKVITNNIKELMDSPFLTRAQAATSPENLADACLKGTLVSKHVLASDITQKLGLAGDKTTIE